MTLEQKLCSLVREFINEHGDERDALAESHAALLEVLPLLMSECDANWEEWTETDDRLLSHTPVGRGRTALAKARKL